MSRFDDAQGTIRMLRAQATADAEALTRLREQLEQAVEERDAAASRACATNPEEVMPLDQERAGK